MSALDKKIDQLLFEKAELASKNQQIEDENQIYLLENQQLTSKNEELEER